MHLIGVYVSCRSWTNDLSLARYRDFEGSFGHQKHFIVLVVVRGMRGATGSQRGLVDLYDAT